MPLVFQKDINAFTKIGVWHISENEDFFSAEVSVQREIHHPHKRLQHLAGRLILKKLYPEFPIALIEIAHTRKPFLADEAFHFSISHCGDYAAAIVSSKSRVGVDIEIPQEKIHKIVHKFLSPAEQQMLSELHFTATENYTLAWGIKEALFKWYGAGNVDFLKDMQIKKINSGGNSVSSVCFFGKEIKSELTVISSTLENNFLSRILS